MNNHVVGLGAWCDFVPADQSMASPGSVSFVVHEFAVLQGGDRVTLHTDRGFGISGPHHPTERDPLAGMTAADIEEGVRTTVLPDDVDAEEQHPYAWLRDLMQKQGIIVSADSLRSVPYDVEFSAQLQQLLAT